MKKLSIGVALAALCLSPASAQDQAGQPQTQASPRAPKNISNDFGIAAAAAPAPEIVQDYEPSPAIWLLEDEDTKIYMFGTIHVLPKNFRWRSKAFDAVVDGVDELVVETSDADSDVEMEQWAIQMFADAAARPKTSTRLSPEAAEKWLSMARSSGIPEEEFDRLPPLLAMIAAGLQLMQAMGSEHEYGVESVLEADFAAAGKPVGSIESGLGVLKALLAIDDELLLADLETDLLAWDGLDVSTLGTAITEGQTNPTDEAFSEEHLWAQGITDELGDLGFTDSPFDQALEKVLLEDRNRAWTVWLEQRLDQPGSLLLAVGAAHLAGDLSVQNMLAERGFTVRRVH